MQKNVTKDREYIEIFGVKFCKELLKAEPNDVDILEKDGVYYFTRDAAMREAKAQGKRLPTKEEFEKAMIGFEGGEGKWCKDGKLLAYKLGLRLYGARLRSAWIGVNTYGYVRSSSEDNSGNAYHMGFTKDNGTMSRNDKSLLFACVVLQDCDSKRDEREYQIYCDLKERMEQRRKRYKDKFKDSETFREMFWEEYDLITK